MSRRRDDNTQEALELFLDTISNMFGGILFIALAVVVLLQFSVPSPAAVEAEEIVVDAAALRAEVDALREVIQQRTDTVSQGEPGERALLEAALQVERDSSRRIENLSEAITPGIESDRVKLFDTERQRGELQRQLQEAQARLAEALARPPQRLRVAKFRPTGKREVPWMLSAGRLTAVLGPDGAVNRKALEIDVTDQSARPRQGSGMLIEKTELTQAELTRRLRSLDPSKDYVALAVWPDAFEEAALVRDTLIDLGFEYGLVFVPEGQGVPFNAAGGVQ